MAVRTSTSFIDLRINNAEQLKESVSEPANNRIYLTFGKTDGWANDAAPPTANATVATFNEIWFNMIGGKLVTGNDIRHVVRRYDWTPETVYTAYDHMNENMYNEKFYVVNSDYSVYKCIANNYGAKSNTEPTSTNPYSTFTTADGYVWKYMYTISDFERMFFMNKSYIPVKTLTLNDGSYQWQVQNDAVAIKGGIMAAVIENGGENYANASNIILNFSGDGYDTTGIATINSISNTVNSIVITNPGFNHTYCNIEIIDTSNTGSGATARAIISPPGGHGSNPLYELGGKSLMINTRLKYDENGKLPITNDYRQIALLRDPLERSSSNVFANLAFFQGYTLTCQGSGDYEEDEIVYQGPSLEASTFSGTVLSWEPEINTLKVVQTRGNPTAGFTLTGINSFTARTLTSIDTGELELYSGRILYVDNLQPVYRSDDQIEDYRIVIEF